MKNALLTTAGLAAIVLAGSVGCSGKDGGSSKDSTSSSPATTSTSSTSTTEAAPASPAAVAAPAPGSASISVDGQPSPLTGPVVCSTNEGKYSIAIGEAIVGVIVGLEPDASVVRGVGLGDVNGVVLNFTEGVPGDTATATKEGNTYTVTGVASGVDPAGKQVSKPFQIVATCP
ncbi:MAG TPA: lipoprotein LpqH [Mycobacterium sp.]|nr:lipoprotein LpqH [Mycobacterium sp.]